jgi:CubicO group peptidase (beta-lactamase class C family)
MRIDRRALVLAAPALALLPRRGRAQGFAALAEPAAALDQLWSLTVAVDGETVFAERFRGPALSRPVNIKSVSKTLVAALTGAAIDRGHLPGVRATLGEVAPRLIPSGADPRVPGIAVEDLLTLRGGLESTSRTGYGAWVSSPDWIADLLRREMVGVPGRDFIYSTGTTHLMGAILSEVTGRTLLDLARDWIGGPLAIEFAPWVRDPQGRYLGGNDMGDFRSGAASPVGRAAPAPCGDPGAVGQHMSLSAMPTHSSGWWARCRMPGP